MSALNKRRTTSGSASSGSDGSKKSSPRSPQSVSPSQPRGVWQNKGEALAKAQAQGLIQQTQGQTPNIGPLGTTPMTQDRQPGTPSGSTPQKPPNVLKAPVRAGLKRTTMPPPSPDADLADTSEGHKEKDRKKEKSRSRSPSDTPRSKPNCKFFAKGTCKYGSKCKFAHVTEQKFPSSESFKMGGIPVLTSGYLRSLDMQHKKNDTFDTSWCVPKWCQKRNQNKGPSPDSPLNQSGSHWT